MTQLIVTLIENSTEIAANYPKTPFSASLLGGGAVVLGPIDATPPTATGQIKIDAIVVTTTNPNSTWQKSYPIKRPGEVFQIADGSTLTIVFNENDVMAVERSQAAVAAMRAIINTCP